MNDDEKLKQQLNFFDYIYPNLSKRIGELETQNKNLIYQINNLREENKIYQEFFNQYKNKIQRIEQMLIEHGLISLLKGKD